MKKILTIGAVSALAAGSASAQGLFNLAPQDEAQEASPLKYFASLNAGWDDNVTPGAATEQDSTYGSLDLGAKLVHITPQTTWDVHARVGVTHYFDSVKAAGADDTFYSSVAGVNWTHRVSDRLRFTNRSYVQYGLEPDYAYGFATTRALDEYLFFSTDNAVGYRWTERLGTYTGFRFTSLDYDTTNGANDRDLYTLYHSFRYRVNPQTIATAEYRLVEAQYPGGAKDATNHYGILGLEHRFSPTSTATLRAGAQFRSVDSRGDSTNPFVEAGLNTHVNEQFSVRGFARYSVEDYDTINSLGLFDTNKTLRLGVSGSYKVSPDLTLRAGVNYINSSFEDEVAPGVGALKDEDMDLLNLNAGFTFEIAENIFFTGSYNYTDSSSSIPERSYDRNRVQLGLRAEF